jgi:hypothetical protein
MSEQPEQYNAGVPFWSDATKEKMRRLIAADHEVCRARLTGEGLKAAQAAYDAALKEWPDWGEGYIVVQQEPQPEQEKPFDGNDLITAATLDYLRTAETSELVAIVNTALERIAALEERLLNVEDILDAQEDDKA